MTPRQNAPTDSIPALERGITLTLRAKLDAPATHEIWRMVVETAESLRELTAEALPGSHADVAVVAGAEPGEPGLKIDRSGRGVTIDGAPVDLTRRELDLLLYLAERPRRVIARRALLESVWGWRHVDEAASRTVDVHVRRLRVKLGVHAYRLTTVRGLGYRFEIGRHETL